MFPFMISQGNQGEMLAVAWLMGRGWLAGLPIGNNPDYDVIAESDSRLVKVQVKTTRYFHKSRWCVGLCTAGGNQSWTGVIKLFEPDRYDYLYAHTACGRRWFIPSQHIDGGRAIQLGGPKYEAFEVDSGPPLMLEEEDAVAG